MSWQAHSRDAYFLSTQIFVSEKFTSTLYPQFMKAIKEANFDVNAMETQVSSHQASSFSLTRGLTSQYHSSPLQSASEVSSHSSPPLPLASQSMIYSYDVCPSSLSFNNFQGGASAPPIVSQRARPTSPESPSPPSPLTSTIDPPPNITSLHPLPQCNNSTESTADLIMQSRLSPLRSLPSQQLTKETDFSPCGTVSGVITASEHCDHSKRIETEVTLNHLHEDRLLLNSQDQLLRDGAEFVPVSHPPIVTETVSAAASSCNEVANIPQQSTSLQESGVDSTDCPQMQSQKAQQEGEEHQQLLHQYENNEKEPFSTAIITSISSSCLNPNSSSQICSAIDNCVVVLPSSPSLTSSLPVLATIDCPCIVPTECVTTLNPTKVLPTGMFDIDHSMSVDASNLSAFPNPNSSTSTSVCEFSHLKEKSPLQGGVIPSPSNDPNPAEFSTTVPQSEVPLSALSSTAVLPSPSQGVSTSLKPVSPPFPPADSTVMLSQLVPSSPFLHSNTQSPSHSFQTIEAPIQFADNQSKPVIPRFITSNVVSPHSKEHDLCANTVEDSNARGPNFKSISTGASVLSISSNQTAFSPVVQTTSLSLPTLDNGSSTPSALSTSEATPAGSPLTHQNPSAASVESDHHSLLPPNLMNPIMTLLTPSSSVSPPHEVPQMSDNTFQSCQDIKSRHRAFKSHAANEFEGTRT